MKARVSTFEMVTVMGLTAVSFWFGWALFRWPGLMLVFIAWAAGVNFDRVAQELVAERKGQ